MQYGEFQAGTLTREQLPVEAWRGFFRDNVIPNAVPEVWEARKGTLNSEFVQFKEENVVNER